LVKDKQREVALQIKSMQDTSNYETKLNNYLSTILQDFSVLDDKQISKDIVASSRDEIDELRMFKENLSINNFSIPEECFSFILPLQEVIKDLKEEYQKKQATLSAYSEQNR
jgi:hypothetical protein